MTDLPSAHTTLRTAFLCVRAGLVSREFADPEAIDAGRGDVPPIHLRFRCTECGGRQTDSVVMTRDALRVTPGC